MNNQKTRSNSKYLLSITTLSALLASVAPASADKLDDFREAVSKVGCDSIPYSDLRSTCRSQQENVHPWCDGERGPVKCDANGTRNLKNAQDAAGRELETLKDKRREIEDKRAHAANDAERARLTTELEAIDKQIDAAKTKIDDLRHDLEQRKDFVDKAIYTLAKCFDYRRAVMNVFAYATDKVRGENDPDVQPYATQLREKYPVAISGHQEQIDNKVNALENCKKERP